MVDKYTVTSLSFLAFLTFLSFLASFAGQKGMHEITPLRQEGQGRQERRYFPACACARFRKGRYGTHGRWPQSRACPAHAPPVSTRMRKPMKPYYPPMARIHWAIRCTARNRRGERCGRYACRGSFLRAPTTAARHPAPWRWLPSGSGGPSETTRYSPAGERTRSGRTTC